MIRFPDYLTFKNLRIVAVLLIVLAFVLQVPWWGYLLIAIIGLSIAYIGTTQIGSNFHLKAHCKGAGNTKRIALSFDDGVLNPEQSKAILAVLAKHQATATFFCIGNNLATAEQIAVLQQMDAAGHCIGNHSQSHSALFDFYSTQRIIQEIQTADTHIQRHIGKQPLFFRPPYGITTPRIAKALDALEHEAIGWSIRSLDTVIKDPKQLLKRLQQRLHPEAIVLFHDHLPHLPTVLNDFLEYVLNKGYTIVGIDELLQLKAYKE